jgi:hypothetical protein
MQRSELREQYDAWKYLLRGQRKRYRRMVDPINFYRYLEHMRERAAAILREADMLQQEFEADKGSIGKVSLAVLRLEKLCELSQLLLKSRRYKECTLAQLKVVAREAVRKAIEDSIE